MTQPSGWDEYPSLPPHGFTEHQKARPSFTVGEALSYGWTRYRANALNWIGILLLAVAIIVGLYFSGGGIEVISNEDGVVESLFFPSPGLMIVATILIALVVWLFQAATIRGALDEINGSKPSFGAFFRLPNFGHIVLASIIVGVGVQLGSVLIVGGVIVTFLSYFTVPFIVDQRLNAFDGIKASWSLIAANIGPLLLLALASIALNVVGALFLGVGMLVTYPITVIAGIYAYRKLSGGLVMPA